VSAVVEAHDVTFSYGERPVLDGVSLTVESGDFLGLVGPNGSGKTTFVELLLGLDRPDRGAMRLFGAPAHEFAAGHRLGYVAQSARDAAGGVPVTVGELVRMGRYPHVGIGRFSASDRAAVEGAMDRVDIRDLRSRRIGELSGGQRQRAFIARALAAEADLLVLDEPAVGVDATTRESFFDLLEALNDDGITVVLIEHDLGVVTDSASHVACLNCDLQFHGPTEAFAESDALAATYGADAQVVSHEC